MKHNIEQLEAKIDNLILEAQNKIKDVVSGKLHTDNDIELNLIVNEVKKIIKKLKKLKKELIEW
jgi:hypothetical protein